MRSIRIEHPDFKWLIARWSWRAFDVHYPILAVRSTRTILNSLHPADLEAETAFCFWDFFGETADERDRRVIENKRFEILCNASTIANPDETFMRKLYDLEPRYFAINDEAPSLFCRRVTLIKQNEQANAASTFDRILAAKKLLTKIIFDHFGERAFFDCAGTKLPCLRILIMRELLAVNILNRETDWKSRTMLGGTRTSNFSGYTTIVGLPIDEFLAVLPKEVDHFPVVFRNPRY